MKRKLWIVLVLAVLAAGLWCGTALASAGLGFVTQPTIGPMDTEELTIPVTWETTFTPMEIKIAYYDTSLDEFIETSRKVTAQKDGSYLFSTRDIGYTYRIHAYYTSYNYLASDPFPLKFIDVSFEPGGALGSTNTLRVLSGVPFTLPECTFTWTHHVFSGWSIGDTLYQPGDTVTLTEDTAIPAAWKKTYTITFSPGSGSGAGGTMEPLEVPVNEEFTLPECTFTPPEGKIFSRWGASGDLYYAAGDTVTATSHLLFVAQWRNDRTYIGFERNGGTGSMNPVDLTPAQASEYVLPECTYDPPADCVFEKWQVILRESGETYYAMPGDTVYLSGCFNVTLKAIWAPKPSYEVTFNANGHGTAPQSQYVMQDKYAADPGALSVEGYTFLGWYTDKAGTSRFNFATTKITGPITLYAKWSDSITAIEISGFVSPAAGMRSVTAPQIATGNTGYVCTRIEWRWPAANSSSGYGVSYYPITFVSNTEYTAVITLETVRDILFDTNVAPEIVTINGETALVDLTRSSYVSETKYQLYTLPVTTEDTVPIDAAHFPDAAFRMVLQGSNYDKNGDGAFSLAEISAVTELNVSNKGIASLQGIEIFEELNILNAVGNNLTTLDLTGNWRLQEIYCNGNPNLAELTLFKNSFPKKLQCYGCALTWLDVRGITYLAEAADQEPVISANGQTKTYTYLLNGVKTAEMVMDAAVTVYSNSTYYARVHFEPGLGSGTMPSVMASKSTAYTLPDNGFTAPEDMYFTGWKLSDTGETFSAGETMGRVFEIGEHEITFIAQWKSKRILSITVPDACQTITLGGFPVDFTYNGSGTLDGGSWLSTWSNSSMAGNTKAITLNPNSIYYAAIRFPMTETALLRLITRDQLVVKNAQVVNVVHYNGDNINVSFLIVSLQPRTVGVLFGSGGGSGIMRPVTGIIPGTEYTLPACDYTPPADMVFDQWSLGAPGTTITLADDLLLIARWKPEDGAIPVTAEFFPDEAFRTYVSENFDTNGGGYLTASEIANVLTLYYNSNDIESFAGIEFLTELEEFECADNSLTELDLSGNTKLAHLECPMTGIATLALDALPDLYYLDCSDNSLTTLDVSAQQLESLSCPWNPLTSLKLSRQPALKLLYCFGTELDTLDLRGCPLLLDCVLNGTKTVTANYVEYKIDSTHMLRVDADTELIVPGMIAVDEANFPDASFRLWVADNADRNASGWLSMEEMDAVDAIYLNTSAYAGLASAQGIEYFTELSYLALTNNPRLAGIDLSHNTKLTYVDLEYNDLTEIRLDGLTSLRQLYLSGNRIETLDVSMLPVLETLDCARNPLTGLTLGSHPNLSRLRCYGTSLTSLDISGAPHLVAAWLGTKDGSYAEYDRYTADGYTLEVDKGLVIVIGIPAPTFTLPAGLTAIEAEAFSGIAAVAVRIPASVISISGNPFAGSQVRYIYGTTELVRNFAEANGYTFVPDRD